MGIFNRMGKVISSNVNSLIDKAEDPGKSIELLVDEMKDQVRAAKKELIDGIAAEKILRKKVEELDVDVEKWDKRAELAMRADDEKLAREALVQKKRVVGERDRAEALRAEQRAAVLSMKAELERMEAKAQEYEARKGSLTAQLKTARAGASGAEGLGAGKGGTAFDEFRRMEDKIDHAHEEVAAHREVEEALTGGDSDLEVEQKFRQLEGKEGGKGSPQIDDELAQLKKKIRIGT